jgi:hypothetical protein
MRRLELAWLAIAAVLCTGCSDAAATVQSRTRMDHGVTLGERIAATAVKCLDGTQRNVGAKEQMQIVTFATPFDCSECTPHLVGTPEVVKRAGLAQHAFWVVWSPNMKSLERSVASKRPELPVCVNEDGGLWDRHDVVHTPFTVVLRNGSVVYMHDGMMSSAQEKAKFAADLEALFAEK